MTVLAAFPSLLRNPPLSLSERYLKQGRECIFSAEVIISSHLCLKPSVKNEWNQMVSNEFLLPGAWDWIFYFPHIKTFPDA